MILWGGQEDYAVASARGRTSRGNDALTGLANHSEMIRNLAIHLISESRLKDHRNNKLAGRLLIASGVMFFIAAATMRQPAFSGVGAALLVVGAGVAQKK